jgi:paraquat-inducible protein B
MFGNRQVDQDEVPEVAIAERRGISIVWLIPLVAAAIAIWLAYTTLQAKGPTITITFNTAEGLEPGKTKVKYKDVEIGLVDRVHLSDDLRQVIVTAQMDKAAAAHLKTRTEFWVVRPRVGATGVSGLGTLLSGAFIEMDPGAGEPAHEFTGLEVPPLVRSDEPGRRFLLRAETLGSIGPGSPIYFRGIQVGQVLREELASDNRSVTVHVFVRAPYDQLVHDNSRFWNASGIELSTSADGVQLAMASVESLLIGGIVFDTPLSAQPGAPSAQDKVFPLYPSLASVTEAAVTEAVPYLAHFEGSVRGLRSGAPVEFRGIRVGTVRSVELEVDQATASIRIPVVFDIQPQRLKLSTREGVPPYQLMEELVRRGLRAQLKSGSLLTGDLLVDLDFHPDAPAAELRIEGTYPEIPSVPSQLDVLTASVSGVLQELASLPLKDLITDLRQTVQGVNTLVASPETQATVRGLNESAQSLQAILKSLDQQLRPTLSQAQSTLSAAQGMVSPDSQLRYDLNAALRELSGAARSIRVFADYLARHPDALIRGKTGP